LEAGQRIRDYMLEEQIGADCGGRSGMRGISIKKHILRYGF